MASTSYLARVIYREHDDTNDGFVGTGYSLMMSAKSIPSPLSPPNTVESTTLEDDAQTFETGIKQSDSREVTGNLSATDLAALSALEGTKLDIIHLYGTDGVGGVAKYGYVGTVTATPNDVGGVDEILEMTATIVPSTVAEDISDHTVTVSGSGSSMAFTVANS